MAKVVYKGPFDIRELSAADLAKVGVPGFRKTSFFRDEPIEVTDEVHVALTSHELFDGEFFELAETEALPELEDAKTSSEAKATTVADLEVKKPRASTR